MTNKSIRLILRIIIVMIIAMLLFTPNSKAITTDEIFSAGENFIEQGKDESRKNTAINNTEFRQTVANIGNILTSIGVALAVIIGAILGIQMMWGSIEQQVKVKEMLMPYAIGCIVIFGTFGIWKLAVTIFSQIQ